MTGITRLTLLALVAIASVTAVAQEQRQSQAEWRGMYELGLKHRTACGSLHGAEERGGRGKAITVVCPAAGLVRAVDRRGRRVILRSRAGQASRRS